MHATNSTIVVVTKTGEEPSEFAVGTFQRGFEYRVSRRQISGVNVLRCDLPHLTTANDPEVFDYDALTFTVCDAGSSFFASCPGDADDSGLVDNEDVDSVLAHWGSTLCLKFGDANRDGVVNGTDLDIAELYLDAQYCYEAPEAFMVVADGFTQMNIEEEPAAMSVPMTVTEAVVAMGYEDTADFAEQFDAMEPAQRAAARACLMALLNGE